MVFLITNVFCDWCHIVLVTVGAGGEIHTHVSDCFLRVCVMAFIAILKFLGLKKAGLLFMHDFRLKEH